MNAWDMLDPNLINPEHLDPEQFSKPMTLPPTRPVDLPQEEENEQAH